MFLGLSVYVTVSGGSNLPFARLELHRMLHVWLAVSHFKHDDLYAAEIMLGDGL